MTDEQLSQVENKARLAALAAQGDLLAIENEFTSTFNSLEAAEGDAHEAGLALGRATQKMRDAYRYKKPGLMARIKELGFKYHKAYYWLNVVEGKPNNRHRKYWDDREFCVTQNSQATDSEGETKTDADQDEELDSAIKEAADEPSGPPKNRDKSKDIVEFKLYLLKNQKIDLQAALKKLINHKVGTNPSEVILKLVTEKAAELDQKGPKAVDLPADASLAEVMTEANSAEMAQQAATA